MPTPTESSVPTRPWRVIAQEIASENDPIRTLDLCRELDEAFEEQTSYKDRNQDHYSRGHGPLVL
jgi:hypothetical protein